MTETTKAIPSEQDKPSNSISPPQHEPWRRELGKHFFFPHLAIHGLVLDQLHEFGLEDFADGEELEKVIVHLKAATELLEATLVSFRKYEDQIS